jgi:hypothetical protein
MKTTIGQYRKPEEEELERKRCELSSLEVSLADRELCLINLRMELSLFEGRYLREIGILYAELDDITARIAERIATDHGTEQSVQDAHYARERAKESSSAVYGQSAAKTEFTASRELKSLYREVARRVHPDLASGEQDRQRRESLMADANRAFEQGDADCLRRIIQEYEASPESVEGDGVGAELVRVIRKITLVRARLEQIEKEITTLGTSETAKLKAKAEDLVRQGRDLFAELAEHIKGQIKIARQQLPDLDR